MIKYSEKCNSSKKEIADLFLSVGWNSGKYPDKLWEAINNSTYSIFAYDNDKLVGLVSGLSDKSINLFISYLLVIPQYQNKKIASTLLKNICSKRNFNRIQLITESKDKDFYKKNHFIEDGIGMFIIDWNSANSK